MAKRKYVRKTKRRRRKKRRTNTGATLNPYLRYQKGLRVSDVYPYREDGLCGCNCGKELTGRQKRWASKECQRKALINFWVIKGDTKIIRDELRKRDHFVCAHCGETDGDFDADHILPVSQGGGGCTLDNFQTLCKKCHKAKTKKMYKK